MLNKKEIFSFIFIFIFIYFIIWINHKLNQKLKCNECDKCNKCNLTSDTSIKIPLLITMLSLVGYWFGKPYILSYISNNSIIKQDIITEIVDF
jgi:hypothetical protein